MSTIQGGSDIVKTNLIFYIDPKNTKSFIGSGTRVLDLTKNLVSDATLVNGTSFNSSGYFSFDGSNDSIDISGLSQSAGFTASSSFTICAWFRNVTSFPSFSNIAGRNQNGPGNFFIRTENNKFRVVVQDTSFNTSSVYSTTNLSLNSWYYGCLTYDGSIKTIYLYLNGVQEGSNQNNSISGVLYATNNLAIGMRNEGAGDGYFLGDITCVKFYNKKLTPSEILQNYNFYKGRFGL